MIICDVFQLRNIYVDWVQSFPSICTSLTTIVIVHGGARTKAEKKTFLTEMAETKYFFHISAQPRLR